MKRIPLITLILQLLIFTTLALAETGKKETDNKNTSTDDSFADNNELSFIEQAVKQTTVGGYISSEYEDFQSQNSTFDQHRLVLSVQSQVHERLSFFSEVEFEHGTALSSETTSEGEISIDDSNGDGIISATEAGNIPISLDGSNGRSGEIEIEQAWLQFQLTRNLGMRAGVVLVPFGRFNLYHDDDLWNLTDRPLVARRVTPTTWSDA
ncbi:MAG: hypothetical protein PHC51_08205, partial [bacterium]|nr:hypothetical protein [bacterium]